MRLAHGNKATLVQRLWPALLLVPLVVPARPASGQEATTPAPSLVTVGPPATLTVWNRHIIQLRAVNNGATATERVARAVRRIQELPATSYDDSITSRPANFGGLEGTVVMVGSEVIFGILPEDLEPPAGDAPPPTAAETAAVGTEAAIRLTEALRARVDQGRIGVILRGVGLTAIATLLLLFLLRGIGRLRRRALARPITMKLSGGHTKALGVDVGQLITAIERGLTRFTALSATLVVGYVWLTFVFGRFPYTQPWSKELGGYLRSLLMTFGGGIVDAIPGLFAVVLIFLLTRVAVRAIVRFFQGVESGQIVLEWLEPETARATRRVVVLLMWVFAIVVAYPYIPGSESDVFKGVSVFLGLMATLGSAGAVNHLVSGLVLVYSRSCKPGDYVRIGDIEGVVTVVGVLSTKISTLKREVITVPNSVLVGGAITNYSTLAKETGAMIAATVAVGYDTPWRQVEALLLQAARTTPGIRPTPEPFALERSLANHYVEYELRAYVDRPEIRLLVLSKLHAMILDAFNAAAVQIMTPSWEGQPDYRVIPPLAPERDGATGEG